MCRKHSLEHAIATNTGSWQHGIPRKSSYQANPRGNPLLSLFHFPYVKHAKYILAAILATLSALNLLLKDTLESDSIGCEFRDTFSQFLDSHCLLIEVESEERLIVEVALLWDVEALCVAGD